MYIIYFLIMMYICLLVLEPISGIPCTWPSVPRAEASMYGPTASMPGTHVSGSKGSSLYDKVCRLWI